MILIRNILVFGVNGLNQAKSFYERWLVYGV